MASTGTDDAVTFVIRLRPSWRACTRRPVVRPTPGLAIPARTGQLHGARCVCATCKADEPGRGHQPRRNPTHPRARAPRRGPEEERDALRDAVTAEGAIERLLRPRTVRPLLTTAERGRIARHGERMARVAPHRGALRARCACALSLQTSGALRASGAAAFEGAQRHRGDAVPSRQPASLFVVGR